MLTKTYGEGSDSVLDIEECASEWGELKRLIKNNYTCMTMRQLFRHVRDLCFRDMFPQLVTIVALIPVSTAECEHAFSSMNRIKTELRN